MVAAASAPRVSREADDAKAPSLLTRRHGDTHCVPSAWEYLSTTFAPSRSSRPAESPTSIRRAGQLSSLNAAHQVLDEIAASCAAACSCRPQQRGVVGYSFFHNWLPGPIITMAEPHVSCSPSADAKKEKCNEVNTTGFLSNLQNFLLKCIIAVLSYGPMPKHIAFIMDGNRRYAKFRSIEQGTGHRVGFSALMANLVHCNDMGVKYITVYAFSIDNFQRDPTEVQSLMDLMEEKINELLDNQSVINKMNCKINFWGDLDLFCEPVRLAAQKVMASTAGNTGLVFSVCMPYNSTSEIVNAVNEVCAERREVFQSNHCNGQTANNSVHSEISVVDLDRHMYSAGCPEPDIVIRTSGETRLSNFLLWQTTFSHLQNPHALWPEFSFKHLVWAILQYQRVHPYLVRNRMLAKKQL